MKSKQKQVERTATPKSGNCEKSGLAKIEDLKVQRLRVALVATAALEAARTINSAPVTDFSKNFSSLLGQLEEVVFILRPLAF